MYLFSVEYKEVPVPDVWSRLTFHVFSERMGKAKQLTHPNCVAITALANEGLLSKPAIGCVVKKAAEWQMCDCQLCWGRTITPKKTY